MHCRRHDNRYTLWIQSNTQDLGEGWYQRKMSMALASSHWRPAADMYETEEAIYLTIELAGVDPEKLEISFYEDALVIEGKRQLKPISKKAKYHMAEIQQGSFCLAIPLFATANITIDRIESQYEQGLLSIVLKKQGESHGS